MSLAYSVEEDSGMERRGPSDSSQRIRSAWLIVCKVVVQTCGTHAYSMRRAAFTLRVLRPRFRAPFHPNTQTPQLALSLAHAVH